MKARRKYNESLLAVFLIAIVVVLINMSFLSCSKKEEPSANPLIRPVKTMRLHPSESSIKRIFSGTVEASKRVELAFRVSGPLIEFSVKEGQLVHKGDLLARIDPRDYNVRLKNIESSLDEIRANLKSMEAGARPEDIQILESEVSAAKARHEEAQLQFKRFENLYKQGNISKSEYDRVKASLTVAASLLNSAAQNLEKGRKGARDEEITAVKSRIKGLEAQRAMAKAALNDTYLMAPFTGVVAKKYVQNFQNIHPQQPVISLQDISNIEITIDVPEKLMAIRRDAYVTITASFEAIPNRKFDVEIKEFSTQADPETKTFSATLIMPAPEGIHLLPGMTATITANIKMDGDSAPDDFIVPTQAVFADEKGVSYAWIVNQETLTVSKRRVITGDLTEKGIYIRQGLKSDEMIVTAGVHYLTENQKIRLLHTK